MIRFIITLSIFSLCHLTVFSQQQGHLTTLHIINATSQSKLFFNTISQDENCLPEFRDYDYSQIEGYCVLDPIESLILSNYQDLANYYPSIKISMTGQITPMSSFSADAIIDILGADWSYIIYKIEGNSTYGGAHIGFNDFISCHGLPNNHIDPEITASTFTIGDNRYFTITEN